jgi:hypothetical protein
MISSESVTSAIDNAEDSFQKCWEILAVMKRGPIPAGFGELFLSFQPTLAGALFQLDEVYRRIGEEKRAAIANKAHVASEQFTAQMREVDGFRDSIRSALKVGRSIGDAFAWFFYGNSQDSITRHLQHPTIPHTPPGVGGKAELAFLDKIRYADCVVIYHGITSFLRIGDLSFLDLRSGEVIALGELKARKVKPGKAVVTLHMMATDRKRIPFSRVPVAPDALSSGRPELQKDMADRLERQIGKMRDALKTDKGDPPPGVPEGLFENNKIDDGYHVSSLKNLSDSLDTSDVAYEHVGSGLLLIGLNVLPEASLSERLLGADGIDFKARLEQVVEHAVKLVHFKSCNNSIRFGEISTGFMPGCAPPFWLPINIRFLRKLYFQGVVVSTIYNPAHVLERFRDAGLTVTQSKDGSSYQIEKTLAPDRRLILEHSNWFLEVIQHHLMKEEKVIECVVAIMEKMEEGHIPPNTKVQMVINTHVFPESTR